MTDKDVDAFTRAVDPKKAIIEAAIKHFSEQKGLERKIDVFEKTCGVWKREESPQVSIANARSAFNKSMERHSQ
ncbi:MAG: hypothetical protein ABR534_13595 [Desulfotignum sp.]